MSLNGLEAAEVTEAYQQCLNEPGGWLLLKYVSRDEVSLLSRGSGGFGEAATAVADYEEKSPLFGFLSYRRRKVVLKYTPEGVSRLLLARMTVHFQAILDKFVPHDAVFNATTASDITESALSASCSLHTATSVYSTTSSFSKQNLRDISEDGEHADADEAVSKLQTDHDGVENDSKPTAASVSDSLGVMDSSDRPAEKPKLETIISNDSIPRPSTSLPVSDAHTQEEDDPYMPRDSNEGLNEEDFEEPRPHTSYSTMSETIRYGLSALKPKVKLFPRPVTGDKSKSSATTTSSKSQGGGRHKMPAGVKVIHRKHEEQVKQQQPPPLSRPAPQPQSSRPQTQSTAKTASAPVPRPIETTLLAPQTIPTNSRGSPTGYRKPHESAFAVERQRSQGDVTSSSATPTVIPQTLDSAPELPEKNPARATASGNPASRPQTATRVVETVPSEPQRPAPTLDQGMAQDDSESEPELHTVSPEKARLLRALEMRQKRLAENDVATSVIETQSHALDDKDKPDSAVGIEEHAEPAPTSTSAMQHTPLTALPTTPGRQHTSLEEQLKLSASSRPTETFDESNAHGEDDTISPLPTPVSEKRPSLGRMAIDRRGSHRSYMSSQATPGTEDVASQVDSEFMHELENVAMEEARTVPVTQNHDDRRAKNVSITSVTIKNNTNVPQRGDLTPLASPKTSPTNRAQRQSSMSRQSNDQISFSKRVNVSSGISRRIQALAESSSRDTSPHSSHRDDFPPEPSVSFLTARNLSSNSQTRPSAPARQPGVGTSRASSPTRSIFRHFSRAKSSQGQRGNSQNTYGGSSEAQAKGAKTITAKIVRKPEVESIDSRIGKRELASPELHKTPTTIAPKEAARPPSRESTFSTMTKSSWKNFGRRGRTEAVSPPPPPPLPRKSLSNASLEKVEEQAEDAKSTSSKTSRILKRFSGLSSGRKSTNDHRHYDRAATATRASNYPVSRMASNAFGVGDLNVQFPDTLLWKRRWVEVDSNGNLILTASRTVDRPQTAFMKRYNLSEFRPPFIPSQDRQELPYSVVLDFVNGGTLQLACEDPLSQTSILKRLTDAHFIWSNA